jgi:hypothetical protein
MTQFGPSLVRVTSTHTPTGPANRPGKPYQVNVMVGDRASKSRVSEALAVAPSFDLAQRRGRVSPISPHSGQRGAGSPSEQDHLSYTGSRALCVVGSWGGRKRGLEHGDW